MHVTPYQRMSRVRVLYEVSNQQIGIKYLNLQGDGLNRGPLAKTNSDTMLKDQLSSKLKLVEFGFKMNIMTS